tara:strand:- start:2291 stop:2944 length:654 start_codon:yes stop_codon:yes gene_type:complete
MKKNALIVAGGNGTRMNTDIPKQFLMLKNKPILMHSIEKFVQFDKIVLVLPKGQTNYWQKLCLNYNFNINHDIVDGGENRYESVKKGLSYIGENSIVAIHDGVRPLISKKQINSLLSKVKKGIGVVPIVPVVDSIRKLEGKNIYANIDRSNLFKVQTPQCFLSSDIKKAYSQKHSRLFTDDSSVFESIGGKINTIIGEEENLKITTKKDIKIASLFI